MAYWSTIKAAVADVIKTNGNQEITGAVLQSILNNIVSAVGEKATYAGVAKTTTSPGTFDGPVFYLASEPGNYVNFGNISIIDNEFAVLYNNSSNVWIKSSIGIVNPFLFPLTLAQGNISRGTTNIISSTTRVYSKNAISSQTIKSIKTSGDIYVYGYLFDKFGNFVKESGFRTELVLDPAYIYLVTFSKGSAHTDTITVDDVLSNIEVEYADGLSQELEEAYMSIEDIDLSHFFIDGKYINVTEKKYLPNSAIALAGFRCLVLKVKAGDSIVLTSITGTNNNAKAYAIYDKDGNRLEIASTSVIQDKTLDIEQDGFVVLNSTSASKLSVKANKLTVTFDWVYAYFTAFYKNYLDSSSSSSSEIQDLSPFFMKNAYIPLTISNPSPDPGTSIAGNYNCISIKVKAGDYFIPTGMVGASQARVYGIFDKDNKLLSIGGTTEELNEQIDIEQDGYIVFNAVSNGFSLYGHFNFFDDWNWMYIVPIMQNLLNVIPFPTQLAKIQDDLYGVNLPSTEWIQSAYFHIADVTTAISTTPVASGSAWKCAEILCTEGETFQIKVAGGSNGRAWAFLNKNRIVIARADANAKFEGEITAPEGANILIVHSTATGYVKKLAVWDKSEEDTKKKIKILCFGNSFTQDSMSYVPMILKNMAPSVELTLGMAMIGGCPLVQHLASFTGENQTLDKVTYEPKNYSYSKSTNGEPWENLSSRTPDYMLADEEWDIITFQQNGAAAFKDWDTYFAPFIFKLHKSLFDKIAHNIKIGWLLTHGAYTSNDEGFLQNWQGTADNAKKMLGVTGTSILFPYGTAVQNLRSTSLKALGDGSAHNLTADNIHVQDGIGCMAAAYANAITILKSIGIDKIGVIGETTRVDANFVTDNNVQGPNLGTSGVVGVTDNNCYLAQVAAECAVKKPYEVTDLTAVESGI